MKRFNSIQKALAYQKTCPLCEEEMTINQTGVRIECNNGWTITWSLPQDELSINAETGQVNIIKLEYNYQNIKYAIHPPPRTSGTEFVRFVMDCENCYEYEYVIQIIVDIASKTIEHILLNSETITVEDDNKIIHEITNSYAFEETEYGSFPRSKGRSALYPKKDKCIKLPLVPLDINDPLKTVARIKNLLVYS